MAIKIIEKEPDSSIKSGIKLVEKNKPIKIIPSKTLIINELSVHISQDMDEDVEFTINTIPGILSDNKTIPKLDITAKEDVDFDETLTKAKLESIIRRCGILDEYKDYFDRDPEIIINQYRLLIDKTFKYFNEFREAIFVASDIIQ